MTIPKSCHISIIGAGPAGSVAACYDSRLQDIIFATTHNQRVCQMICSILAGYAWDENNPYVAKPERGLPALAKMSKNE